MVLTSAQIPPAAFNGPADQISALEDRLNRAIIDMLPDGILAGCRQIRPGDESHLTTAEAQTVIARQPERRWASAAARMVAHGLLETLGVAGASVPRSPDGSPIWPDPVVGSLAHDDVIAVACVAPSCRYEALGIDIEPADPLPGEVEALVRTVDDVGGDAQGALLGRVLFCAKEAVYKAVYPRHRKILDYEDISVDLVRRRAVTTSGDSVTIAFCSQPRIVVVAFRETPEA